MRLTFGQGGREWKFHRRFTFVLFLLIYLGLPIVEGVAMLVKYPLCANSVHRNGNLLPKLLLIPKQMYLRICRNLNCGFFCVQFCIVKYINTKN